MALNSLQTATGTRISLHNTAIIVEHQTGLGNTPRYARLRTLNVVGVARRGRSSRTPLNMLEVQDYNQSPETAQYSTPYFMSREELPQAKCNSLKTVQVSRLGANGQSEHM